MNKIIILFFIILFALSGCDANTPQGLLLTTDVSPSTTVPTTATKKTLSEMTDYELLCTMAEEQVCIRWATCSFIGDDPLSVLMEFSTEFRELMTRETAADSIRTHLSALNEKYPDGGLLWLESYVPEIDNYINENAD